MEITHKSALFVLRRIRHGLGEEGAAKLTGTVEADETYVGGRPRKGQSKRDRGHEQGAGCRSRAAQRQRPVPHDGAVDCEEDR